MRKPQAVSLIAPPAKMAACIAGLFTKFYVADLRWLEHRWRH
jgi:hypothetical protein